jgi:hypothetical protein
MRSAEAAIDVRASPETVFDLVHDYPRRLESDPFLKEARLLEGAEVAGPGVITYRFDFATRPTGLRLLEEPIASALFRRDVRQRLKALKSYLERRY